jgi:hypothetical protein
LLWSIFAYPFGIPFSDTGEQDDNEVPETQQPTDPASSALRSTPETVIRARPGKRKSRVGSGAEGNKRPKKAVHFDETPAVKPGTESHFNPENPISAHNEILSPKRGAESEFGLLSESMRELRELNTILGKRLDIYEATIYRLSNKVIDLEESLDEAEDDVKEIDEKVSGMITDRDQVITALAKMVNSELSPGHSSWIISRPFAELITFILSYSFCHPIFAYFQSGTLNPSFCSREMSEIAEAISPR